MINESKFCQSHPYTKVSSPPCGEPLCDGIDRCCDDFGLFWLAWILVTLFAQGIQGLMSMPVFGMDTPPPMVEGGLRNAIVGSIMISFAGLAVGTTDWDFNGRVLSRI